ncbi:unnamed protein product, partial [Rotaria sordida]
MSNIESILSLLPMLIHLRLIAQRRLTDPLLFDGFRWENFIKMKVPLLNKFEFSFIRYALDGEDCTTVESLIAPFRTLFWLELKRWFIKCDYEYSNYMQEFHLYSIPIFQDSFDYPDQQGKMTNPTTNYLFRNVTELTLTIDRKWPMGSIEHLSTIVNLSNLQTVQLYFGCE